MVPSHKITEYLGYAKLGCVYAIGPAEPSILKVGYAGDVRARLVVLQCGNWEPLFIHAAWWFRCIRIAARIEGAVQVAIGETLVRGEWYRIGLDRLQLVVSEIATSQGTPEADIDEVVSRAIIAKTLVFSKPRCLKGTAL